jgi:large subunit ribosomal protein L21
MAATASETSSAASMKGAGHTYAVVVDGGRQYRVMEGMELEIDFRHLPAGGEVVFDDVLAVSKAGKLTLGKPKFKRRKNYRRRTGHRALATKIRVSSITA